MSDSLNLKHANKMCLKYQNSTGIENTGVLLSLTHSRLTHDAPEGSAMYSSGPSGPNEENMMLEPKGLSPSYTVYR